MTVALVAFVAAGAAGDTAGDFIDRHWRAPLAPQGAPPARYSEVEASLAPEACGTCHPVQLADWKTSLHAKSMGPGVTGQLADMLHADPSSAATCFRCHAPLAEQALRRRGAHLRVPPVRVLPELSPVHARRVPRERQAAREHVPRVEGESLRARGRAVPGLPHARSPARVARHSRSGHGALGCDRDARAG